ncbi:UDP-N-acetylmuramate--L-alanine ligase [Halobacteriovorax sp. HLS]|uniref:UDP-N-acetylmuramate--L-alanine ligase n=1 Tax=Halobacteriovorax sp. HLS TaxID=2234000 RepID=UPI000FD81EAB|nr:Mur ligase family protein [Halobacteriovorax sp. HLS]
MNLINRITGSELKVNKNKIKKIFLYRICGTGMGASACLLREKGYEVEGGDTTFYPPMSNYLESTGIPLHDLNDFDMDYLRQFDLIVVGNVVPRESDEAKHIEELGVAFTSFPAALGALVLDDVNVVGVAGTHGKTTTTYLMTQVFEKLGFNPGYFIGGVLEGRNSSSLGDGKYFFIESDEYDSAYFEKISKFRLYSLNHMILTSLEFDHADIFNDIEDIKNEFRHVFESFSGKIFYDQSYDASRDLVSEYEEKVGESNFFPYNEEIVKIGNISSAGTEFRVAWENSELSFSTNLVGTHNILNLCSVILFALSEGIEYEKVRKSVESLTLVRRRQEVRGKYKGAVVIDDFAHHPRAVALTTEGIKNLYPNKSVKVVIEPNSATARSSIFQKEFATALEIADYVIFSKPVRPTSVKGTKDLDGDLIISHLKDKGVGGVVVKDLEQLRVEIDRIVDENTILLVLSNGTCLGLWQSTFIDEIS